MSNQFDFKYSAPTEEERKEIASIRKQYAPDEQTKDNKESKLERLRRLDAKVKDTAIIWSLVLGVVGCLVFGLGLALVLEWKIIIWGVIVCAIGCVPMIIAYPTHNYLLKLYKKRYGEEIIKLSEELLNEK